jgi:translation elongation factor EF-Tu-like GTPase
LRLLSSGEGGRTKAISSGYRPNFCVPNQTADRNTDGVIFLIDRTAAKPGEKSKARVTLLHPEFLKKPLRPREGGRKVGEATIDDVLR